MRSFAFVIMTALALSLPTNRVEAAASLCGPGMLEHNGAVDRCYPPAAVAQVERELPAAVVSPGSAVRRFAHLHLTQLSLRECHDRRPFGITYLFGTLPSDQRGIPLYASKRFPYVLVDEVIPRINDTKVTILHTVIPPGPGQAYPTRYWEFVANLPLRNMALHIISNRSRGVVAHIGYAILRTARSGK